MFQLGSNVTFSTIRAMVRAELGTTSTTGYAENFAIHQANFYLNKSTSSTGTDLGSTDLSVLAYNVNTGEIWGQYDDSATVSGVANIRIVLPVNDRPTFSGTGEPSTSVFIISSAGLSGTLTVPVVMDLIIDYTKSATAPFGLLMRELHLGDPVPPRDVSLPSLRECYQSSTD